jgi:predicted phosphodiesterase
MRLAVLSDIHGNYAALQAVLADLEAAGGADTIWVLGDLVAFGPAPLDCLTAVRNLPEGTKVIRGNTDRELITGQRPYRELTEENWSSFADMVAERNASYDWTLRQLAWEDADYLLKLPSEVDLEVEGYGWVVGFHAVPGNDEVIMLPDADEDDLRDQLSDRAGRLALCGHTHRPTDRDLGRWRWVNPGSIGFPFDGDQRAAYAIITFEGDTATLDQRRVAYDVQAVIDDLKAKNHPAASWAIPRLQTAAAHPSA